MVLVTVLLVEVGTTGTTRTSIVLVEDAAGGLHLIEMFSGTVCVVVSGSHWRPSPIRGIVSECYLCAGQ